MQALIAFFDLVSPMLHGFYGAWRHQLLWISVLPDAIIALSYYVISLMVFYLIGKRKDLPYLWLFGMAGFFIAACGTAHLLSVIHVSTPLHGLDGGVKAITAFFSLAVAVTVICFIPKALRLPNAAQFQIEVDERKKAEAALQKRTDELKDNQEKFRSIYESSSDAIMLLTEKGFFDCNSSTLKIFGLTSKDEFIATHPAELSPAFQPDGKASLSAANEKIATAMIQGVNRFEWMHRRKNGENFPALVSLTAFDFDGKRVLQASVRDITEYKQVEAALQLAKQNAEAANRAKSEFLANMSHEIRTPMNAILGLTQVVLDSQLTLQQKNYLRKVLASSKSLLGILNDILDFSKIESGHLEIENVPFQIKSMLEEVTHLFDASAAEKGLALYVDIDKNLPLQVVGDPLRLTQVLNNLFDNALKFTDQGEIRLGVELMEAIQDNLTLRFILRDTGIGLSQQQSDRLFQPFTQADGSMTRKYGGTGLGLVICQKLVGFMGGEIAVSGAPGEGCCVSFTIRVERLKDHDVLPILNQTAPASPSFNGADILLVEDNAINQEVAAGFLKKCGISVTLADNGQEALEWVQRRDFDAVLMDLHMPVMDGFEATTHIIDRLKENAPPVIAMTAAVMPDDRERCARVGMVDFMAKPIDLNELTRILQRWLKTNEYPPSKACFEMKALPDNWVGFDLSETLSRLGGDHELLGRLLQIFIDEQSDAVAQLDAYLKAGELLQAAVFLHTLKGVAGNLGATALAQAALQLEHEIKSGNELVSYSSFVSALDLTLAAFDQYIKQSMQQEPADIDQHDLTGLFNQLIPYLRNSEVIPPDLMQSLYQFAGIGSLDASLSELILQIDRFNHDKAIDCIEKIAANLNLELSE